MSIRSVRTDSPIEEDFMAAMYAIGGGLVVFVPSATPDELRQKANENRDQVFVSSQVTVGRYRLDFLFASFYADCFPKLICVECDGAAYHREPHQIIRDMDRDSELLRDLIVTTRISGARLRRDSFACARDVLALCGAARSTEPTFADAANGVLRQMQWMVERQ